MSRAVNAQKDMVLASAAGAVGIYTRLANLFAARGLLGLLTAEKHPK